MSFNDDLRGKKVLITAGPTDRRPEAQRLRFKITILTKRGSKAHFPLKSKVAVAQDIPEAVVSDLVNHRQAAGHAG